MAEKRINPEVSQSLRDMSPRRVQENAEENSPRHFWSALKNGHYRFALAGVALSVPLSAAIGAGVAAAAGVAMLPVMFAFVGAGALIAADNFGAAGAAAASRASGLAEKHARLLDAQATGKKPLDAVDDRLMANGKGHHFQFPENRDDGKLFSWKSGLTGAAMGAASGAVLGLGSLAVHIPAVTAMGTALAPALAGITAVAASVPALAAIAPAIPIAVVGAVAFGLYGLTFGVERKVYKTVFNRTDAHTQGNITVTHGPDVGRMQSHESDRDLADHRVRRQLEIQTLEKSYNEKISWGALRGRLKGIAGGVVPGLAIGAAVGALAVAGIALIPGAALASGAGIAIASAFAAGGGLLGIRIFGESSTEAGAEANARAIDTEFERNRALRAQGITPPPPEKAKGTWINPKTMLIAGSLGAGVGLALSPALAGGILALTHAHVAAAMGAELCALTGGIAGAAYGIGDKTLKAMAKPFEWVYDKASFAPDDIKNPLPSRQPGPSAQYSPVLEKVTGEDIAAMNQKTAAKDMNFAQTIAAQQQISPAALHM